jgi:hypothetical protein
LPNKCELCNGTFNCRAAEPIGYGSTPCEVRQFAFAFQAYGCQGGLYQETSLQVYDESVRLNPDVATFNVHIFRSADDRIQYGNCSQPMPTPIKSFLQQSCTGIQNIEFGLRDPVPDGFMKGPLFVVECLSPEGCWIRIRHRNKCTLKGTGAFPIGVIGIILCSLVVIGCIALSAYFVKHKRFVTGEMWYQLVGIALIMILNLVFWICFVLTAVFVYPPWYTLFRPRPLVGEFYSKITDTIYWIDKIVLILSSLLHLTFLYQFVSAVHNNKKEFLLLFFGIVAGLLLASIGLAIIYYSDIYSVTGNYVPYLIAFYSMSYGFQMLESLLFLVYGLVLLRAHWKISGFDKKVLKTVVLLLLLLIPNIGRLIVVIFAWLRFYFALSSGLFNEIFFGGFDYFQMRFRSHSGAALFYVFGFLIPDTLPFIVLALLLFDSVHKGAVAQEQQQSEIGVPLLESSSRIPSRYEV